MRVGRPDLLEGKNGLEVRGVVWSEREPQTSYFVLGWDAAGERLSLETDPGALASELKVMFETALAESAVTAEGSGGRLKLVWNLSRGAGGLSGRVGTALGGGWGEAVGRLLTADASGQRRGAGALWNGVPREQIPWYPAVDLERCDGCGKCLRYCSYGVFESKGEPPRPEVVNPLACLVGCDSCARICPREAIQFPPRGILTAIRSSAPG